VANKISRARSASTIYGLWKTYKCLFIQNCTRVITWLLVNNALKNILEVFLDIVSLDRLHSAWYSKYLQKFPKMFTKILSKFESLQQVSGELQKSLERFRSRVFKSSKMIGQVIFIALQKGSGNLWKYSDNVKLPLVIFRRLWLNFNHPQNTLDNCWLSYQMSSY